MISRRQIISGSAGPIFAIFTSNESFLAVDDRSGPLFRYLKGRCHGNRFCAKNGKLPTFVALAFRNGMGYRYLNGHVNSASDACISRENFVKFGPVTHRVRTVPEEMDRTQYPIFRPQFRPTQDPIRRARLAYFIITPLVRSLANAV